MKKILSLVLVLMMVLSCAAALAEYPAEYDGSAVTITFRHITKKDNQLAVIDLAEGIFQIHGSPADGLDFRSR